MTPVRALLLASSPAPRPRCVRGRSTATQRALAAPTRELLFAVGWTGNAWAIGQLVDLLETTEDEALASGAAWALERLTGAGLWEEGAAGARHDRAPAIRA